MPITIEQDSAPTPAVAETPAITAPVDAPVVAIPTLVLGEFVTFCEIISDRRVEVAARVDAVYSATCARLLILVSGTTPNEIRVIDGVEPWDGAKGWKR